MSFYLELQRATNIRRGQSGVPYAWQGGKTVEVFRQPDRFLEYVRANRTKLKNVVAFTGSATVIASANRIITEELQRASKL